MSCHSLLQGIFLTQGLNPGLLHCKGILYYLSHCSPKWNEEKWSESHSIVSNSLQPHGTYSPWKPPGQNTRVGSFSLLQGIFPTQGSNPGLPHCRQILYQLRLKESPRILEWIAYPFFSGSSQTRNRTRVSCIAGRFFTNWAIEEDPVLQKASLKKKKTKQKRPNHKLRENIWKSHIW